MEIAILKGKRYPKASEGGDRVQWKETIEHLERRKRTVYTEPVEADLSIVLSGLLENPAIVRGKRVLAFKPQEWMPEIPPPKGWMLYYPILQKYYDDFIDLSGLNPRKSAKRIIEYINGIDKS